MQTAQVFREILSGCICDCATWREVAENRTSPRWGSVFSFISHGYSERVALRPPMGRRKLVGASACPLRNRAAGLTGVCHVRSPLGCCFCISHAKFATAHGSDGRRLRRAPLARGAMCAALWAASFIGVARDGAGL